MQEEYQGNGAADPAHFTPRMPPETTVDYGHMIKTVAIWRGILNARLLALFSLTGGMVGFGFAVYDPTILRLWALAIYCVLCLWPVMALFFRKG